MDPIELKSWKYYNRLNDVQKKHFQLLLNQHIHIQSGNVDPKLKVFFESKPWDSKEEKDIEEIINPFLRSLKIFDANNHLIPSFQPNSFNLDNLENEISKKEPFVQLHAKKRTFDKQKQKNEKTLDRYYDASQLTWKIAKYALVGIAVTFSLAFLTGATGGLALPLIAAGVIAGCALATNVGLSLASARVNGKNQYLRKKIDTIETKISEQEERSRHTSTYSSALEPIFADGNLNNKTTSQQKSNNTAQPDSNNNPSPSPNTEIELHDVNSVTYSPGAAFRPW